MAPSRGDPIPPPTESTDLWDAVRHRPAFAYPSWFVVVLGVTGLLALLLTGFLGYAATGAAPLEWWFHAPWPLFLWGCAVLFALQAALLRPASLRRYCYGFLAVSSAALLLVVGLSVNRQLLPALVAHLVGWITQLGAGQGVLLGTVTIGLVVLFWIRSIRRWVRSSRGYIILPKVVVLARDRRRGIEYLPSPLATLVAGDLLAAAVLVLVLAWLLYPVGVLDVLGALVPGFFPPSAFPSPGPAPTCFGLACTTLATYQAVGYALLALVVLGATSLLAALSASGARSVREAFLAASRWRARAMLDSLLLTLRPLLWPLLLIASFASLGVATLYLQTTLQQGSCALVPERGCGQSLLHGQHGFFGAQAPVPPVQSALEALGAFGAGLLSLLCLLLAAALFLYRGHVLRNALTWLWVVGRVGVALLWIVSLALSGVNWLIHRLVPSARVPFHPGLLTALSFGACVIMIGVALIQRWRGREPERSVPLRATHPHH